MRMTGNKVQGRLLTCARLSIALDGGRVGNPPQVDNLPRKQ